MNRVVFLIVLVAALSACKIEIAAPVGATVTTASGSISCVGPATCVVDVTDVFFDETFVIETADGFSFSAWRKRDRGLCGGSEAPCRLFTSGFVGVDSLLAILESDETFFLEPIIAPPGSALAFDPVRTTFAELDSDVRLKPVSTSSPEGTWLVYGHGVSTQETPSLDISSVFTLNLFATVVTVRSFVEDGQTRLGFFRCPIVNSDPLTDRPSASVPYNSRTGEFSLTLSDINLSGLSGVNGPNIDIVLFAGDTGGDTLWKTISADVTLVENKEMVFAQTYKITDTVGDVTGSSETQFYARKISDDIGRNLGSFVVDGVSRSITCHETTSWDEQQVIGGMTDTYSGEYYFVDTGIFINDISGNEDRWNHSYTKIISNRPLLPLQEFARAGVSTDGVRIAPSASTNSPLDMIDIAVKRNKGLDKSIDFAIFDASRPDQGTAMGSIDLRL